MFITLLIVTLVIALATSLLVIRLFDKMIRKILDRLVSAELSEGRKRYSVLRSGRMSCFKWRLEARRRSSWIRHSCCT